MRSLFTLLLVCAAAPAAEPDANKPQIAFEIRVLEVRDNFFERVGIDIKSDETLSDRQMRALMVAAQGDPSAKVLMCPKMTSEDGQEATVHIAQQETFTTGVEAARVDGAVTLVPRRNAVESGVTMAIRGRADGKAVTVQLSYQDVRVASVETVAIVSGETTHQLQVPRVEKVAIEKKDLAIPSGGHAILTGPTRQQETRYEFGPPIVSQIPYINRLFRNVGVEQVPVRTLLIVSPKVIAE